MKNRIILCLVIFSLMVIPVRSVAAAGDIQPTDPRVGTSQDASIKKTLDWMIQQPPALSLPINNVVETIDRASLDAIARSTGSYGFIQFTGFDASLTRMNSSNQVVSTRLLNVLGSNPPPPPQYNCDSWVTSGIISLVATKDAPTNPVVFSQDPNRSGVNLTWTLNILPTVYTYGLWELIPYPNNGNCKSENAECAINNSGKACCTGFICVPNNPNSGNGKCEVDPNMPPIWACVNHTINYQETYITLEPKAILTTASRNWILNDLARAYPGTTLKHPDWGFRATEPCIWDGDTCVWTHIEGHVQVADPGWYDLMITGTTGGTEITLPRLFTLTGGQFGVYLVETSMTSLP
jgi:hypothetical protein